MRQVGLVGTVFVLLCLAACSGKDGKGDGKTSTDNGGAKPRSNAEKIIGKWKVTRSPGDVGTLLEFTADGKAIFRGSEKSTKSHESTYKVEGDKLTTTGEEAGENVTRNMTIKSLTETTLVIVEKDAEIELTRMK
jgi:uncharacterized protein (TIGR03066 family)